MFNLENNCRSSSDESYSCWSSCYVPKGSLQCVLGIVDIELKYGQLEM